MSRPFFPLPDRTHKLVTDVLDQLHERPEVFTVSWDALSVIGGPIPIPRPYSQARIGQDTFITSYFDCVWEVSSGGGPTPDGRYLVPFPQGVSFNEDAGQALYVREVASGNGPGSSITMEAAIRYFDTELEEVVTVTPERTIDSPPPTGSNQTRTVERSLIQFSPYIVNRLIPFYPEAESYERPEYGLNVGEERPYEEFVSMVPFTPVANASFNHQFAQKNGMEGSRVMVDGVELIEGVILNGLELPVGTWVHYLDFSLSRDWADWRGDFRIAELSTDADGRPIGKFESPIFPSSSPDSEFCLSNFIALPNTSGSFRLTERLTPRSQGLLKVWGEESAGGDATEITIKYGLAADHIASRSIKVEAYDDNIGWYELRLLRPFPAQPDAEGFWPFDVQDAPRLDGSGEWVAERIRVRGERPANVELPERYLSSTRVRQKIPPLRPTPEVIDQRARDEAWEYAWYIYDNREYDNDGFPTGGDGLVNPLSDVAEDVSVWGGLTWESREYVASSFYAADAEGTVRQYYVAIWRQDNDYRVGVGVDGTAVHEASLWAYFPGAVDKLAFLDGTEFPKPGVVNLLPSYEFCSSAWPGQGCCRLGPFTARLRSTQDRLGTMFTADAADSVISLFLESFENESIELD